MDRVQHISTGSIQLESGGHTCQCNVKPASRVQEFLSISLADICPDLVNRRLQRRIILGRGVLSHQFAREGFQGSANRVDFPDVVRVQPGIHRAQIGDDARQPLHQETP
jgi:hypothetical protein